MTLLTLEHHPPVLGISVIVCCYNSETRLLETLKHLSYQRESGIKFPWEIIIVNNNSSDETVKVAHEYCNLLFKDISTKIINETKPGLSFAREKGIAESAYEYLILCDDDNWLAPNYLLNGYNLMQSNPNIGILGGRSEAITVEPPPFWFSSFQLHYAVGCQARNSGEVTSRGYVWGSGMILRRSIFLNLKKSGFRSLLTDRKGESLSSGGDSEICQWFILAGYHLWYDENLQFQHFIEKSRLSKEYHEKLIQSFEESGSILSQYASVINFNINKDNKIKCIIKFLYLSIRVLIKNNKSNRVNAEAYNFLPFSLFSKTTFSIKKAQRNFYILKTLK